MRIKYVLELIFIESSRLILLCISSYIIIHKEMKEKRKKKENWLKEILAWRGRVEA